MNLELKRFDMKSIIGLVGYAATKPLYRLEYESLKNYFVILCEY